LQARIIAISNQKGGVAKTTTCLSFGACLAERGKRTLIVDLDSQANLTIAAGLDADALEITIVDLFFKQANAVSIQAVIQPTAAAGMDIIPGDVRLAGSERLLYEQDGYEFLLKGILADYAQGYEFILLDCPPSLGAITLMALTAADEVLIPVQCEYYAAHGLGQLLNIVNAVQERTNIELEAYVLGTMYDKRNRICHMVLEQLQESFPEKMIKTVIGVDTRLRETPVVGEPITMYAPKSRASQQYRELAEEYLQRWGNRNE